LNDDADSADFRAVSTYEKSINDHRTGRKCTRCGGALHDTIINFGEDLPQQALNRARSHAKKADLCLVLGSSVTVSPANTIPATVGRRKTARLAICNLQKTPLDDDAEIRVHTKTDDLMVRVMRYLQIPIPEFVLRRRLAVEVESQSEERHQLRVDGLDVDGTPVTFLQSVKLASGRRAVRVEPFVISIRDKLHGSQLMLELEFMGHYGEPNLVLAHDFDGGRKLYLLEYHPQSGEWKVGQ
jgi:mono-ADP-ribosyltransferase sirtuin 6